eukprot:g22084.t1
MRPSSEDNVTKLTRGAVKLCQVVGVFPGARMNDGTEEELDVDVELLNWEESGVHDRDGVEDREGVEDLRRVEDLRADCAQNLVARVDKTWRQLSSQKYRSILDLVSKKADHSVLRLLQISQQHIESQLDRIRHERELWKEVVDKRAQQPLQLALTLKDSVGSFAAPRSERPQDPHTGQPMPAPQGYMPGGMGPPGMPMTPRAIPCSGLEPIVPPPPSGSLVGADPNTMKASPLAKRIARPVAPPAERKP